MTKIIFNNILILFLNFFFHNINFRLYLCSIIRSKPHTYIYVTIYYLGCTYLVFDNFYITLNFLPTGYAPCTRMSAVLKIIQTFFHSTQ